MPVLYPSFIHYSVHYGFLNAHPFLCVWSMCKGARVYMCLWRPEAYISSAFWYRSPPSFLRQSLTESRPHWWVGVAGHWIPVILLFPLPGWHHRHYHAWLLHGWWGSELRSHPYTASGLITESPPQSLSGCFHLIPFKTPWAAVEIYLSISC